MGKPSSKRFTRQRRLGEGGMGVVYEAHDEERGTAVALKTLSRFDGDALARFKREFRALQGLLHPNLVALDELFFEDDEWFFTMELLDGVDFVSHVTGRPAGAFDITVRGSLEGPAIRPARDLGGAGAPAHFDETKLRDGLRQLLAGLSALHAVDRVHRDVKPSNVLVTREGRVVLLDLGLVTEASVDERSTGTAVLGTPAYMAPEQAASRGVGPAADLYAVGVMLYEVLTGRLPFDGPPLKVLLDKQTREPPRASSLAEGVPADLDALCAGLLAFEPASRPTLAEAVRAVVGSSGTKTAALLRPSTEAPIFVGRRDERAELRRAFESSRAGNLSTVLVCGESGIGKSHLVRHVTGQLLAEHPDAVLLEGRCYERESVPYKTLDGVVEALSRKLSRMDRAEVAAILPTRSAVLAEVFPVLLRIPQMASEHAARAFAFDPQELRQRAFTALRELFTRLALRRPTVVVIDDLQWADDDGLRALAEVLRSPDAPPLLLLGTVRVVAGTGDPVVTRVRAALARDARVIDLSSLGREDTRELVLAALKRSGAGDADPDAIATEAAGHPLFIEELVRHVALGGSEAADGSLSVSEAVAPHIARLDDVLWSRVLQLEAPTRRMAELIAIAGKPIPQEVVAAAAQIEPAEFNRRAAVLRASNLVRTGGARWADAIEPYHDRVREAVLARLEPAERRRLHEAVALAFEASSHVDPETLATHWREAGNASRAARQAGAAGDQAAKMLAFDRAARWYELALELLAANDPARRELQIKAGEALANAGRGALAGDYFQAAAVSAPAPEAMDLRRRAAEQLLRGGEVRRGLEATRAVLAELDLTLPRTRVGTIVLLLWFRFLLRLRGLGFRPRDAHEVSPADLQRIDVCWSASCTLTYGDPFFGALFQARHLLFALAAGERLRVARALALEAAFAGATGPRMWPRAAHALGVARRAARECPGPYAAALVGVCEGISLSFQFRFTDAIPLLEGAIASFKDECPGSSWEVATARQYLFIAQHLAARYPALIDASESALREAIERGDRYEIAMIRSGYPNLSWLLRGEPARARAELDAGRRAWPARPFQVMHFYALVSDVYIALYEREPARAARVIRDTREDVRRSMLLALFGPRMEYESLCCHVALAQAAVQVRANQRPDLRLVDRWLRLIGRPRVPFLVGQAEAFRASRAILTGETERALSHLERAAALDAEGTWLYATCARFLVASMRGGAGDDARVRDAVKQLEGRGIAVSVNAIALLYPGFEPQIAKGLAGAS